MFGLFRRPKLDDDVELAEALANRAKQFAEAEAAMKEVDRVNDRIIADYRLANGRRRAKRS